jgi:hypothetical protein
MEAYTLPSYGQKYACQSKGNTLVDITPRGERPVLIRVGSEDGTIAEVKEGYPIFMRDHMKADKAPMSKVTRYVHQH